MKVLWLVERNASAIASVRLRALGIAQQLRRQGVDAMVSELRHGVPAEYSDVDIVVFSKAYSEMAVVLAERLKCEQKRIHFDLCDNRFIYGDENLLRMLTLADGISCGSKALAGVLAEHGYDNVCVINDYMEKVFPSNNPLFWPERTINRLRSTKIMRSGLRLVWFGSSGSPGVRTGMDDVAKEVKALNEVARDIDLHLVIVSNSFVRYFQSLRRATFPTSYFRWHPETFSPLLMSMDLAIIPVSDSEFNRCKTENRLLTCFAHSLPVVASPIPSYMPFADFAYLGDISAGVKRYIDEASGARERLQRAISYCETAFSVEAVTACWLEVLAGVARQSLATGQTQ